MESKETEILYMLFAAYYDTLINYCRRKGYSKNKSKKFVDETFYRLAENIDKVADRHLKEQRAWLYFTVDEVMQEYNRKKIVSEDDFDEV